VNRLDLSRRRALKVAGVVCLLLAVVLTVTSPSVPAAPVQSSSHRAGETQHYHTPRAQNARARGDVFDWEQKPQAAREDGLDKVFYLPLVLKGYRHCRECKRFGFGAVRNPVDTYDVSRLHAGWYVTFGFRSDPPSVPGLEYAQTIRLCEPDPGPPSGNCWRPHTCESDYTPGQAAIVEYAISHPGTLWLIGNEPDAPGQDCITPGRYAELYHELYEIIKGADQTARVAIGGVVQATPLRLEYLDRILSSYASYYPDENEGKMPVDVWNVHGFILPEEAGSGAGIPPGGSPDLAVYPNVGDHDNMTIFRQQIVRFRQWMKDRGERDKPLIVSEYGILYPIDFGFNKPRVKGFMLATFDYFLSATSSTLGYPDDGNRLVQAWNWYSLDDYSFEGWETYSHLFDPYTMEITPLGIAYGNYTASVP
jgi:hypothetical protein